MLAKTTYAIRALARRVRSAVFLHIASVTGSSPQGLSAARGAYCILGLIVLTMFVMGWASGVADASSVADHAALLDAIRHVESGGNVLAVGDQGRSRGAYQIQAAYWHDACEFGGVEWDYRRGVLNDAKCRQVVLWYAARYGAHTDEQIARCHNSGSGWKNKYSKTDSYWSKVRAALCGTEK